MWVIWTGFTLLVVQIYESSSCLLLLLKKREASCSQRSAYNEDSSSVEKNRTNSYTTGIHFSYCLRLWQKLLFCACMRALVCLIFPSHQRSETADMVLGVPGRMWGGCSGRGEISSQHTIRGLPWFLKGMVRCNKVARAFFCPVEQKQPRLSRLLMPELNTQSLSGWVTELTHLFFSVLPALSYKLSLFYPAVLSYIMSIPFFLLSSFSSHVLFSITISSLWPLLRPHSFGVSADSCPTRRMRSWKLRSLIGCGLSYQDMYLARTSILVGVALVQLGG